MSSKGFGHGILAALAFYREMGLPGIPGAGGRRFEECLERGSDRGGDPDGLAVAGSGPVKVGGAPRPGVGRHPAGEPSGGVIAAVRGEEAAERETALSALRVEMGECVRCKLSAGRKNIVFGTGNARARVMFVGEAPGAEEDVRGLPFVGRAGELLTRMIEAMGTKRENVYIANIVKCRPPGNRDPQPDEIGTCIGFLHRQVEIIRPEVIVTLGRVAVQALLDTGAPIGKLRGKFHEFRDAQGRRIPVMPTYHPAYLLRSPGQKRFAWEDLQQVMSLLGWAAPPR